MVFFIYVFMDSLFRVLFLSLRLHFFMGFIYLFGSFFKKIIRPVAMSLFISLFSSFALSLVR